MTIPYNPWYPNPAYPYTAPRTPGYYPTTPVVTQKGWECPKCGSVMAPFMPHCSNCLKKKDDTTTTKVTTVTLNGGLTARKVDDTQVLPTVCAECGRVPKSSWVDAEGRIGPVGKLYCGQGGCLRMPG